LHSLFKDGCKPGSGYRGDKGSETSTIFQEPVTTTSEHDCSGFDIVKATQVILLHLGCLKYGVVSVPYQDIHFLAFELIESFSNLLMARR